MVTREGIETESARRGALAVLAALVLATGCNAILGNEPGKLDPRTTTGADAGGATATGGSSASGGGGGTGATGGGGPGGGGVGGVAPECGQPSDCPGVENACQWRTCEGGACGVAFAPEDTPTADVTTGDCAKLACDGLGGTKIVPDDTDVLDDGNECTTDSCTAAGPVNEPVGAGAACSRAPGQVCDGAGSCVECLGAAECSGGLCQQHQCVPLGCNDGVKNGDETAQDCGGADCAPCADGEICVVDADCASEVCTSNVCAVPTCADGVANGPETDVDCGLACAAPCGPGAGCQVDGDCAGGLCTGSVCAATCSDGAHDGDETDVDCGGPVCGGCALGDACVANGDCTSDFCFGASVCDPSHCGDGQKNGGETAVDCGGSCTQKCNFGQGCASGADCKSGACALGLCV